MRNYWSYTKFADWIRGTKKPFSETATGWKKWNTASKGRNPIRYWIAETLLDGIQSTIWWPIDHSYNIKYYIVNRWVDQSHALVAHPKHIKPGKWKDLGYRILHCTFDELVDYVEIEKAYSNYRWDSEKVKDLKWWQGGRWRTRTWRSAEAGLEHLRWELNLDDKEIPTSQALAAKEIMELYDWWVNVRPKRVDPMEASGWSAYCDSKGDDIFEDDQTDTGPMLDQIRELEEKYFNEDTEMLVRLIDIRGHLWT